MTPSPPRPEGAPPRRHPRYARGAENFLMGDGLMGDGTKALPRQGLRWPDTRSPTVSVLRRRVGGCAYLVSALDSVRSLVSTSVTPSVPRAMAIALSISAWLPSAPERCTTP